MAGIPSKIEIEIEPTMKGKKLPLIQRVKHYELDSFLNRKDIVRGELFIDENTGDLYVAEKGDVETYWLRLGRTDLEKEELNLPAALLVRAKTIIPETGLSNL